MAIHHNFNTHSISCTVDQRSDDITKALECAQVYILGVKGALPEGSKAKRPFTKLGMHSYYIGLRAQLLSCTEARDLWI